MRRLDRLHLEFPFAGARTLRGLLVPEGCKIGRRHVKTLMRRMGIEALYLRPRTTKPEPGHKIFRTCCAASRSCDRTRCGRWTSLTPRWRVASSISPSCSIGSVVVCCRGACRSPRRPRSASRMLEDVLAKHGRPDLFNTDQGSQFTGSAFTGVLANSSVAISMDGKGAWKDNVFVEWLWRSVKYEEVYLRAYAASARPVRRSDDTSTSTIIAGRIRALTAQDPISPTSPRCPSLGSLTCREGRALAKAFVRIGKLSHATSDCRSYCTNGCGQELSRRKMVSPIC
jgi:putative transposase